MIQLQTIIAFVKEDSSSSCSSSIVWSVIHSGSLYVQSDTEVQFSLGPILGIQPSKDKVDCIKVNCRTEFSWEQWVQGNKYCMIQPVTKRWKIQVKFKNESFPKLLPLGDFVANKESCFSRFESCGSGTVFADLWKEAVKPYLDKRVGDSSHLAVKTLHVQHHHLSDTKFPSKGNPLPHLQLSSWQLKLPDDSLWQGLPVTTAMKKWIETKKIS